MYYKNGNRYEGEFKMIKEKEKELCIIKMEIGMMDNLKVIKRKEKVNFIIIMMNEKEMYMLENLKMNIGKEKVHIIIIVGVNMKEIGKINVKEGNGIF